MSEEKEERKMPEFIFVEEGKTEDGKKYGEFKEEFQESVHKMEDRAYPISVRIVCLIMALFLSIIVLISIPFLLGFLSINLVTFFQMGPFWERTQQFLETFKKLFVTVLGLIIAFFSPAFGLSVIMVYFMMRGQQMDQQWVSRIMESRFYKR